MLRSCVFVVCIFTLCSLVWAWRGLVCSSINVVTLPLSLCVSVSLSLCLYAHSYVSSLSVCVCVQVSAILFFYCGYIFTTLPCVVMVLCVRVSVCVIVCYGRRFSVFMAHTRSALSQYLRSASLCLYVSLSLSVSHTRTHTVSGAECDKLN